MEGAPKQKGKEQQQLGMTRRQFGLATGATVGLAALTGPSIVRNWPEKLEVDNSVETTEVVSVPETVELATGSEEFDTHLKTYRQLFTMPYDSIFFVDNTGKQVGGLVQFEDFVVEREKTKEDGTVVKYDYLLTPGKKQDNGFLEDNIAGEWIEYVKQLVAERYGVAAESLSQRNVTETFEKALENVDEPELISQIINGERNSVIDLVHYFGDKPVRGFEHQSRIEYVRENITFTGNLSKAPVVANELRRLLVGLAAVESKYDDDVTSKSKARGIFQFKPDTWHKELGRSKFQDGVSVPLTEQVVAVGELFSKMYDRIFYWSYEEPNYQGRNYLEDIKKLFSTQEDFEKYFLTPFLINAYNTGEKGIGEVIQGYAKSAEFHERLKTGKKGSGYDVFQAMTDFGKSANLPELKDYDEEASRYVQKIYAFGDLLNGQASDNSGVSEVIAQL